MPRQRRILIVDSDDSLIETWKTELGNKFHITHARNIPEAEEILADSPEFAAIAIESFHDGETCHAISFIQRLRIKFQKPVVAVSPNYTLQQEMILAGCNVFSKRNNLPNKICEALKISAPESDEKTRRKLKRSWKKAHRKELFP